MLSWKQFTAARPDLTAIGAALLYEYGHIGLGFLATVRADGGPRVHPVCPMLTEDGLYAFVVPGPKLADLRRDPRYALHSETFPPPRHDDAFYVTGHALVPDDPPLRSALTAQFLRERQLSQPPPELEEHVVVEFTVDRCLLTLTQARDGLPAGHTVWTAQQ